MEPKSLFERAVEASRWLNRIEPERIDRVLAIQSDNQVYKQAGNGVTVTVVKAIGRRLAAVHNELEE
jgi:site-specific DNA-cytosine methylase